jgi:hypothetical protein
MGVLSDIESKINDELKVWLSGSTIEEKQGLELFWTDYRW